MLQRVIVETPRQRGGSWRVLRSAYLGAQRWRLVWFPHYHPLKAVISVIFQIQRLQTWSASLGLVSRTLFAGPSCGEGSLQVIWNLRSNFEPGRSKQWKVRNRISKSILNVTGSHCGDLSTGLMCLCLSVEPCSQILSRLETAGYSGVRRLTHESAIYENNQI